MSIESGTPVASIGNLAIGTNLRITSSGTSVASPGNATLNTARGKSAVAALAAAVTITNSLVTANSIVLVSLETVDATLTQILTVVPGSGSFVVTGNAAATGTTQIGWVVINL